jgi:hypothetical protein
LEQNILKCSWRELLGEKEKLIGGKLLREQEKMNQNNST